MSATTLPAVPRRLRLPARLEPGPVAWTTVALMAALMAYADGFVRTALEGAVGTAARAQEPFANWLRHSTLMLPLFVLTVLGALAFARSRFGPALRSGRKVVGAALLIAAAGGVIGTADVAMTLTYDYHLQSEQLRATAGSHGHTDGGVADGTGQCTGTCAAAQKAQLAVDLEAARIGSAADVAANVVLVGWVLAARGGRLEKRRPAPAPRSAR